MQGYRRLLLGLSVGILLAGLGTIMAVGGTHSIAWEGDSTPTPTPVSDNPLINQYFAEADQLMCIGDFAGAVEVYNQAIAADPTFARTYISRGIAYTYAYPSTASVNEILADVATGIRLDPTLGEGYALRGAFRFATGDYDAALDDFTTAMQFLPPDWIPGVYLTYAKIYQAMGKTDLMLENANHALELDAEDTDTLVFLAEYYMELGDYDSALYYADTAVGVMRGKDNPSQCVLHLRKNAKILVMRGKVYLKLGELTTAVQDFTDALTFDPENYDAYEGRGRAYVGLGQSDDALPDLFRLVELEPTDTAGYTLIAYAYVLIGNYRKVISYGDYAILLAADNANAYYIRGSGYWGIWDFDAALADFSQAITLNPTLDIAYYSRGLLHNQLRHQAEALADLKEYQRLVGEAIDPETLDLIERLEAELGE